MTLIGINGFKTSGKDTTYNLVKSILHGQATVERAAFADKLKIMAARALGFDRPDAELIALMDSFKDGATFSILYEEPDNRGTAFEDTAVMHTLTGREYLQHFGGRAREVFGDSFWVDQILPSPHLKPGMNAHNLSYRYPGVDCLCITDVRYPNEASRVKALGGVMWEVIRPGLESDGHSSEIPLPEELIDWQIVNDADFATLRGRVVEAMAETL